MKIEKVIVCERGKIDMAKRITGINDFKLLRFTSLIIKLFKSFNAFLDLKYKSMNNFTIGLNKFYDFMLQ